MRKKQNRRSTHARNTLPVVLRFTINTMYHSCSETGTPTKFPLDGGDEVSHGECDHCTSYGRDHPTLFFLLGDILSVKDGLSNCIGDSILKNLLVGAMAMYVQTKWVMDGTIQSGSCLVTVLKHEKRQWLEEGIQLRHCMAYVRWEKIRPESKYLLTTYRFMLGTN